jgi:hypothetical protein
MATELIWNAPGPQDWVEEQKKAQVQAQREAQAQADRAGLRRVAPVWRSRRARVQEALAEAEGAQQEADAAVTQRTAEYLQAVHAQTAGTRPQAGPGVVLLGFYCATNQLAPGQAAELQPARREWEALQAARQAAGEAATLVLCLRADLDQLDGLLAGCEGA